MKSQPETQNPKPDTAGVLVALFLAVLAGWRPSPATAAPVPPWTTNGPPGEVILSLAVDPVHPTTVYAGAELGRIFKSTDGGMSWDALDTGLLMGVNALVILPASPNTIYAGTQNGAFVSTDAGRTWSANGLEAAVINALVLDHSGPVTLYAGVGGGGGIQGVFRSDGGGQWHALTGNLPDAVVNALAVDAGSPGILYAATDAGVFRTMDRGVSWVAANTGLPDAAVNALALVPSAATVYAGTEAGVYVSRSAADTWRPADETFTSAVSSILIDPQPESLRLFAGTFGDGVFASTDGGTSWNAFNDGLSNDVVVRVLAGDGRTPPRLFAGTIGDGVFVTQAAAACVGDCDASGEVTVDEIIMMVNLALGNAAVSTCPAADPGNTGTVTITQIIRAVNDALNGCASAG
jgi:photosystem II stability/assembly factor-like uncharacterized protein